MMFSEIFWTKCSLKWITSELGIQGTFRQAFRWSQQSAPWTPNTGVVRVQMGSHTAQSQTALHLWHRPTPCRRRPTQAPCLVITLHSLETTKCTTCSCKFATRLAMILEMSNDWPLKSCSRMLRLVLTDGVKNGPNVVPGFSTTNCKPSFSANSHAAFSANVLETLYQICTSKKINQQVLKTRSLYTIMKVASSFEQIYH